MVTERFDLLAWNMTYAAIFPRVTSAPPGERNTLLSLFTAPTCCSPVRNREAQCDAMVAQLRAASGRHVGDPAWTHFIRRMEAESPAFATAWAVHDVAQPASYSKDFRHPGVGRITATSTSFAVQAVPGARMVIYTPANEPSKKALARLAAGEEADARFPCWSAHDPERAVASLTAS